MYRSKESASVQINTPMAYLESEPIVSIVTHKLRTTLSLWPIQGHSLEVERAWTAGSKAQDEFWTRSK